MLNNIQTIQKISVQRMIFSITLQPCPLLLKCPTHQTARIAHNIYHFLSEVYFTADLFFLNMLRCSHRLFLAVWMRMTMATPRLVIMSVWFSHPVCLFPVTGPIYSVGLVNLPGRLWETDLQVPASQPTHCTGPAGEVCCHLYIYLYIFIWNIFFHILGRWSICLQILQQPLWFVCVLTPA